MQFLTMLFDILPQMKFFVISFDAVLGNVFDILPQMKFFVMSFDAVPGNVI